MRRSATQAPYVFVIAAPDPAPRRSINQPPAAASLRLPETAANQYAQGMATKG